METGPISSFTFCAYWPRTLHVLCTYPTYVSARTPHVSANPRDMPYRGAWELPSPSFIVISSSSTLVYRHRHLFSCDIFAPENILSTFCQLCEHFLVNHTLPLTYFLSIASYCFTFDICLKWKSPVGTYRKLTNRCDLDALIGRFFLSSWKVQLLRVNFFEFAVSSGNLRLRTRWV